MDELTELKIERFKQQMVFEMRNNSHKGSIEGWDNYDEMMCDLEYHKAKMMMAITTGNIPATKEYIADCANLLMCIGNLFGLYDSELNNELKAHEINRIDLIQSVPIENQAKNHTKIPK